MNRINYIVRVLVALMFLGAGTMTSFGQLESKNIALSVGDIRDLKVPFDIKNFEPGNRDVVQAQTSSSQTLTVTGLREGRTDLKVTGDGDQTLIFKITVGSSLDAVIKQVRKDLDAANILGVEAEGGLGKVVLRGLITKPEDWSYLKKTILPSYGDQVQCMVQFRLQDELMLKLKGLLQQAHFKVQEGDSISTEPGTMALSSVGNSVLIAGSVYARGDLDTIQTIINSCPWLTIRRQGDKLDDNACYAVINVSIAPVLLEVDVSFVGVSDAEATTLGANLLQGGLATISTSATIMGDVIHGKPQSSATYFVNSSMSDTVQAISGGAGIGPARFSSVGHLTFKNDATDWKEFHDGGTIELPVSGGISGSVGIQPIDYGLILKAKGGLVDAQNASLDLQLEMSVPVPQGQSIAGPIYNLKKSHLESTIICPVGKTLVMGGTKQLTEGMNINSETPILGQLPLLQFLFSSRTKTSTDRQVLILISPQLSKVPVASAPISDQTIDTLDKAAEPISSITKPTHN
jgi:hypothetical protein